MKDKLDEELRTEIMAYLLEIKEDLDSFLNWASTEVSSTEDAVRAGEVVEDTMHRLLTIAYYLATFFEDSDPSTILMDLTEEVSEEQSEETPQDPGQSHENDPPSRTRH